MNNKIHYICQNCGKEFDDDKDEKLNCPFCGAEESQISMSATPEEFLNIVEIESQDITCDNCYSTFKGIEIIENDSKCPNCNKTIDVFEKVNEVEKEYVCNLCNFKFSKSAFINNNGSCPNCHENLMHIDTWEDYVAVDLDGQIEDDDWSNI